MKRILLAMLLASAPAFAHGHHDRDDDDDDRWEDRDEDSQRLEERRRWEEERRQREEQRWEEEQRRAEEERWERERYSWSEPSPPAPEPVVDFRSDGDLDANGRWIDTPEYGTVWQPVRVSSDWQPYRFGRWAWTDAGWAWVSDEPFGWAVYHYGRWGFAPALGWYWVPGRVWAPAWVEWRFGDRYAGWCALGPAGIAVVQPARWVWVETPHLLEPVPHHVVPLPPRYVSAMTVPVAGPRAGPPVRFVERAVGRAVVPVAARSALGPRAVPAAAVAPRPAPAVAPPSRYGGSPAPRAGAAPQPRANFAPPALPQPRASFAPPAQPQPRVSAAPQSRVAPTPPAAPQPQYRFSPPHAAAAPQPRAAPAPTARAEAHPGWGPSRFAQPRARASW